MMYQIQTYKVMDRREWSRLVQESATGTWFQTPEAYEFFASLPELFNPFALGLINEAGLRGVCVGYVTKELNAVKQFFTRRAIIVGGPCIADDATDEEVRVLMGSVRAELAKQAIYIESRNLNDYGRWRKAFEKAGFAYKAHLNFHVDCMDKELMWGRLSESRRRQIKKAQKNGVEVVEAQTEQEIQEWFAMLHHLYVTKVKTPLFPLSFFLEFHRRHLGTYLLVKKEGKIIGGIMCPILDGKCIYEWFVCGNDVAYKECYPSVMTTYAAMEYGNAHRLPRFDFMGAGQPNEPYGVREFKAEFGGKTVEYGRFLYVNSPFLYSIGCAWIRIFRKMSAK